MSMSPVYYVTRALGLLPFIQYATAAANTPVHIERVPRSPEQMSAFYAARGLPAAMIDLLAKQYVVTARIHNTGKDVIWPALASWHFSAAGK